VLSGEAQVLSIEFDRLSSIGLARHPAESFDAILGLTGR